MDSSDNPLPPVVGGKSGNYLQCPYKDCNFYCRYHSIFNSHLEIFHYCSTCFRHYANRREHQCTNQTGGGQNPHDISTETFKPHFKAHKNTVQTFLHKFDAQQDHFVDTESDANGESKISLTKAFFTTTPAITELLKKAVDHYGNVKVVFKLCVIMTNTEYSMDGLEVVKHVAYFSNKPPKELHSEHGISELITFCTGDIQQQIQDYITLGSGFSVDSLVSLEIKLYEYQPFRYAKGQGYLKMPFVRNGLVNFRTEKDCFKVCVVAGINWKKVKAEGKVKSNQMRSAVFWRRFFPRYDFEGLPDSVAVFQDIGNFEDRNNVAINVFTNKDDQIIKLRQSKKQSQTIVNLFLIRKKVNNSEQGHYVLITDLSQFISKGRRHRRHVCPHCLKHFGCERFLFRHAGKCKEPSDEDDHIEEVYPKEGETMHFRRPEMLLFAPAIVFYDWETFLVDKNEQKGTATVIQNELVPASFSMVLVMDKDGSGKKKVERVKYYDGENLFEEFWRTCFEWSQYVISFIRNTHNAVQATPEEIEKHKNATQCELCERTFSSPQDVLEGKLTKREAQSRCKVLHHHHLSSKYLGTICNACNLRITFKHELVFVAHNASKFDNRLITRNLDSQYFDKKDVSIIGKSTEQFTQIKIRGSHHTLPPLLNPNYPEELQPQTKLKQTARIRFIDSCLFLLSSLDKLVSNLEIDEELTKFNFVRESFPYIIDEAREATSEDLRFLLRKWNFPYRFLSPSCLDENVGLPSRSYYDNDLTGKKMSDSDWEFVQSLCSRFNITNFRQLLRSYCILDTLLLSCVFEAYRDACKESYGLDPSLCMSSPNYSWNCFLYHSKAQIDFMRDPQMVKDVERGLRGGFCFATRKIIEANSERTPRGFDDTKPRSHILYADVNGLYAHSLCKKFPKSGFRYLSREEIQATDWSSDDLGANNKGFILTVDLKYPHNIMESSKYLPYAPYKRKVKYSELSQNQRDSVDALGSTGRSFLTHPKLILDQADKKDYVIHYEMLRYILKQGMILEKVHRAFEFEEEAYFKSYVEMNIKLRQQAQDTITSNLAKLNSNSLYGKSIQSNINHFEIVVCGSREEALKYISCSRLRDIQIINENLSLVYLVPQKLRRDTIIQAGFSVLELAKLHFYNDYYNKLVPMFDGRASLSYCDTDSCIMYVESDPNKTFLEDLLSGHSFLDYSKLPKSSDLLQKYPHLINSGKSISGYWKLESIDIIRSVFVKPKMYSNKHFDDSEENKAKGVQGQSMVNVVQQTYIDTITKKAVLKLPVTSFRSFDHKIFTVKTIKTAFTDIDVSRNYPTDDINYSLPYFNHKLYDCKCDVQVDDDEEDKELLYDSDETCFDSDGTWFDF